MWKEIPTLKEATGTDISYLMLRGIFAAPKIKQEVQDGYVELFKKVTEFAGVEGLSGEVRPQGRRALRVGLREVAGAKEATTKDLMSKGGMLKK